MNPIEIADQRFQEGYSCSQSVFSALAGRWNIDRDLSLRLAAGLGGGIARSAGTCGCVTGAILALGMTQGDVSPEANRTEKEKTYEFCRRFLRAFEERHGSTVCSELMGCDISTPEGFARAKQEGLHQSRCRKFVRDAVEIADAMLGPAPGSR